MKPILFTILALLSPFCIQTDASEPEKPRIVVLTDIENEPDDAQSLVRFLLYSNCFDLEGIIATTSTHQRTKTAAWRIHEIIEAYGKIRDNLLLHEPGFPEVGSLRGVVKSGRADYGMHAVGPDMDSEGSEWLIRMIDREDPRPLWVTVWGGPNVLAQALWKIRSTRSSEEVGACIQRLRVYTISDQDDSGPWIRNTFPDLFYIVSPGNNYRRATWAGISGENWYRFSSDSDLHIVSNEWLKDNIRENHGPLGEQYPAVAYIMEGDTPSFLGLIPNGLNVPGRPDWGGWGGRYNLHIPPFFPYSRQSGHAPETRPIWTDAVDEVVGENGRIHISNHATIWRWREAYQNDFAARMDWCVKAPDEANHPPIAAIKGTPYLTARPGDSIQLDASRSSDPDDDDLQFKWIHYPEAGDFWDWHGIEFEGMDTATPTIRIPSEIDLTRPATTHIILAVTDSGAPSLTRYQRVILTLQPVQTGSPD